MRLISTVLTVPGDAEPMVQTPVWTTVVMLAALFVMVALLLRFAVRFGSRSLVPEPTDTRD
ncbi:hypothetical protein CFN78_09255 [Amycolatopsis antarctica]|uniref:Uncharacterized protein n=1 Tax=Amycolatopsis antarctica TaxID=1854586 RepID=A0A263D8H7_9PSEU|nr:hypothetical protein [Amycolatopsis antarctica]OZM73695.1 hypothetical protein CFN78_09255 [Amycolatopsis antarctica]